MSNQLKQKTIDLQNDLKNTIRVLHNVELEEFLSPRLKKLEETIKENKRANSLVKVVLYGVEKEEEWLQSYWNINENNLDIESSENVIIQTWDKVAITEGANRPLVLIVIISAEGEDINGIEDHLKIITEGVPLVKVYCSIEWPKKDGLKKTIIDHSGHFSHDNLNQLETLTLSEELASILETQKQEQLALFNNFYEIKHIRILLDEKVEKINLGIISRKQQIEQQIAKTLKAKNNNYGDSAEIKRRIQSRLKQFEKRFNEYIESKFDTSLGKYYQKQVQTIEQLNYLEKVKAGKQINFSIPPEIIDGILSQIKKDTLTSFLEEKVKIQDFRQTLEEEIEQFLIEKGLTLSTKSSPFLEDRHISQWVNAITSIDREFVRSTSDRGMMEYFMGARQSYMMIFMGLSMFGLTYLIRQMSYYLIPISTLLVGMGVYQVWSNQQVEKEANKKKNLEEARKFLKEQIKKILQNLGKKWEKEVIPNLKEQAERLLDATEEILQSHDKREKLITDGSKARLQSILDNLKTEERTFEGIKRNNSTMDRDFERLKADICRALQSSFAPQKSTDESRYRSRNY